jgi:hypothetical protein
MTGGQSAVRTNDRHSFPVGGRKPRGNNLSGLVLSGLANKESFYWPKVMTPKMPLP